MAEAPAEKKEDTKDEEKKEKPKTITPERFFAEIVGIAFLGYLVVHILQRFFNNDYSWQNVWYAVNTSSAGPYIRGIIIAYISVANILSLFFLAVVVFSLIRIRALQRRWTAMVNPDISVEQIQGYKNERWHRVVEHSASDNPSDWRLAVLEADIILDELLDAEGYVGDTIGDKLKKANPGDFRTLEYAWEAHRIRNAIAHEGQDFVLSQREARRILGLYELVFKEFNFV